MPKGPSFFYHHTTCTFVATQMATNSTWSTRPATRGFVDADSRVSRISGELRQALPFDYTYYAYRPSGGSVAKTFHCLPDKLVVDVETDDTSFVERLPLVIGPGDDVSWLTTGGTQPVENGVKVQAVGIKVARPGGTFELRLEKPAQVVLTATPTALFSGAQQRVIRNVDLSSAASTLTYSLQIKPQ